MITVEQFHAVVAALGTLAQEDIKWSESIVPPEDADDFAFEAIFVICNSGMKNTVARGIYERVASDLYLNDARSARAELQALRAAMKVRH